MRTGHIAVIDIGKTNAKLALVDLPNLSEIAVVTRPNTVLAGPPYPHFDVELLWGFLLDHLALFHAEYGVDAISVTTHGASAALIGADGNLAAPIIDYEHAYPQDVIRSYDRLRPPFSETGSPRLACGLNLGAQIHYQFETVPGLPETVETIVTYPQYWGLRLTSVPATDVTSLGCHTDLWAPFEGRFSSLVDKLNISNKLPGPRPPNEVLGPILPEIAERTGLPKDTPVFCGIHDSNASLLPHLLAQNAPFSVVSTGTWVIAMTVGGLPVMLDPERDTLVNVNSFGDPVPSARFMGGREHDLATGGACPQPTQSDIERVLDSGIMLLPSLSPETGPFAGCAAGWIGPEPALQTVERGVCAGFYLALVTAECLRLTGHQGKIIVEGPLAKNIPFCQMLGAASGDDVLTSDSMTGTSQGAALLALSGEGSRPRQHGSHSSRSDHMAQYARRWMEHVRRQ